MLGLDQTIQLLLEYRYVILFPIAILEGPIITVIGGFLSAQGILNLYLVYSLVVVGDMIGDLIFYAIGRFGGLAFVNRWGKFFGVTADKLHKNEQHFEQHAVKTLIFGKSQPYGNIILTAAGMAKMPLLKFIWINFASSLVKSGLLIAVGYFFGQAYGEINRFLNYFGLAMLTLTAIFIVFYYSKKNYEKNSDNN